MKKATADEMLVAENLQTALFTNDIRLIETMIANRTNLNVMFFFPTYNCYISSLGLSMLHKDISIFKLLLQARVNPNIHMKSGTDLMDAINSEKIEHIKLLLKHGAKLYIKNRYNQTAVSLAKRSGCKDIIELIENEIIRRKTSR